MNKKKSRKYFSSRYKLSLRRVSTSLEVWHIFTTRARLLLLTLLIVAVLFTGALFAIIYTPIADFIPELMGTKSRMEIENSILKLDSLEQQVSLYEHYTRQLQMVLEGRTSNEILATNDSLQGTIKREISQRSLDDSLFREAIEAQKQISKELQISKKFEVSFAFITPISARVIEDFAPQDGNYGVLLSPKPNSVVLSVLDGTVIQSNWTAEDGYVVTLQHAEGMISIYKGLQQVLKQKGMRVKAGEGIGISEMVTQEREPRLRFELWNATNAVDPQNYIIFTESESESL
ncbi:MAG: peptidoglycan DD-metalloendopeptidase family protein [Rikenellaceae bacterium]